MVRDVSSFYRALVGQNQFAIKLGLDAVRDAAARLGLRAPAKTAVLVAGTNGKGTTCATLNAMCMAAGLRVGLYTSPHLVDFRERIRLDGEPVPAEAAGRIGWELLDRFGGGEAPPEGLRPLTYFELATLLAWRWFCEHDLDVAIIEVGMGGRLDATNAMPVDLCAISNVDLDHQEWLGHTVHEIAFEKAGIGRAGVPVVMNRRAVGVREAADHLERAGVEVRWVDAGTDPRTQDIAISRALFEEVARRHRLGEVATRDAIEAGGRRCRWPGRQEVVVTPSGTWWVDGAHNPNGIAAARDWLRQLLRQAGLETVDAVVGVSPDRDAANLLRPLRPYVAEVTATAAVGAKATPVEQLEQALRGEGFAVRRAASLCEAVLTPSTRPRLLIGSLYLVGSAFDAWGFSAESLRVYDASA